jgi:hypothetical protein
LGVTRLAPLVARAELVLGLGLTLQTAPLLSRRHIRRKEARGQTPLVTGV